MSSKIQDYKLILTFETRYVRPWKISRAGRVAGGLFPPSALVSPKATKNVFIRACKPLISLLVVAVCLVFAVGAAFFRYAPIPRHLHIPPPSRRQPTMLARTASLRRTLPTLARRAMSSAPEASGSMTLNFNLPHETIYSEAKVSQVIVPGSSGEYGVTADHVPIVAQLKAGVLQIIHEGQAEPEKYFVAGGFSLTHPNSVTVSFLSVFNSLFVRSFDN